MYQSPGLANATSTRTWLRLAVRSLNVVIEIATRSAPLKSVSHSKYVVDPGGRTNSRAKTIRLLFAVPESELSLAARGAGGLPAGAFPSASTAWCCVHAAGTARNNKTVAA